MDPISSHMCIDVSYYKHTYHVLYSRNKQSVTQSLNSIWEPSLGNIKWYFWNTDQSRPLKKSMAHSQLEFTTYRSPALPYEPQSHHRNSGWKNPIWSYMCIGGFLGQTCVTCISHAYKEQTINDAKREGFEKSWKRGCWTIPLGLLASKSTAN